MSIIGWIILGLIAGFIASKIVNKQGGGIVLDIFLGVVGAIAGGFLFSLVGAAVGAVVVLLVYHAIPGRSPPSSHLGGDLPGV